MAASLYSPVHASNSLSRDAFLWLYLLLTLRCHMRLKTINCYPVMTTSTWMSLCGPFIRTISIYSYECYESIHIWEPLGRRGKKMLQGPSSQSPISTNWLESWNSVSIFTPWSSACSGYSVSLIQGWLMSARPGLLQWQGSWIAPTPQSPTSCAAEINLLSWPSI